MASTSSTKRQKTASSPPYELIYWPGDPGRGEHIRLAFEATGTAYTDTAHLPDGMQTVLSHISTSNLGDALNPPPLAPPVLKHGDLVISQAPNILLYLGPRLGLVPQVKEEDGDGEGELGVYRVNQLALTALDGLSNEAHDVHHPISNMLYYEDQKEEAKRKAQDYIDKRLPKFLGYFERVLKGEASKGGVWLYGGKMSYADLVLFQCLDGVKHAFPNAIGRFEREGEYKRVFELYERVKNLEKIKAYLASGRRLKYAMGIWRYYPELDEES